MTPYSTADREQIFAGRTEKVRVNLMQHSYGHNYERTHTTWFDTHAAAMNYATDNGCVVECDMGSDWYADEAFANHNAKFVAMVTLA